MNVSIRHWFGGLRWENSS